MSKEATGLYGLENTNRDFTKKESWGKNQFNSSFPASLCCYLSSIGEEANYLSIQKGKYSSVSTKSVIRARRAPSTKTFTVPSGNFNICKIVAMVPAR